MLFLGIDQHARQLTVSLRDQEGDVILARQVFTRPKKVLEFFDQLIRRCLQRQESFIAVVEVCGFNDQLIRMLRGYRGHKVILIQPEERKRCKTDRRDAAALSELLWVNRDRFLEGKPVRGLRQVDICNTRDQETASSARCGRKQVRPRRSWSTRSSTSCGGTTCNGDFPPRPFRPPGRLSGSGKFLCPRSIGWR